MRGYSVEILETSMELTAKQKIMVKDTADAIKLDIALDGTEITIKPVAYVVLGIHNEKADDKDYKTLLILAEDGTKYITGSESFADTFLNIFNEMEGSDEEWALKMYKLPSKNYNGKEFLTCSII